MTGQYKTPNVLWAQRSDILFLRVDLQDTSDRKIDLGEDTLSFEATGGTDKEKYDFKLNFYAKIDTKESQYAITDREVLFKLIKAEKAWWPRPLNTKSPFFVKADWSRYIEEEDEEEETESPFGQQQFPGADFSQFGDPNEFAKMMSQMKGADGGLGGGMPGMPSGPGGVPDFDPSQLAAMAQAAQAQQASSSATSSNSPLPTSTSASE